MPCAAWVVGDGRDGATGDAAVVRTRNGLTAGVAAAAG